MNMDMATAISEQITPSDQGSSADKVVLSARHLHKAFGGQIVLNNVSLNLHQGEIVLLRGENGSGKTTLLNILTGNLEPDKGSIHVSINGTKEAFTFPRQWWKELNPFDHFTPERVAREGIGRVWQGIRLFPTMTTKDNIVIASTNGTGENPVMAFLPSTYRIEKENRKAAVQWLTMLGIGHKQNKPCDEISLGEMKRVAIGRAIRAGAKILLLDEPLSGLDGTGITMIVNHLKALVKDHAITLVIVEHSFNIPNLIKIVDTVWSLSKSSENQDGYRLSISEPSKITLEKEATHYTLHAFLEDLVENNGQIIEEKLPGGAKIKTLRTLNNSESILEIQKLKVKRGIVSLFEDEDNSKSNGCNGLSLTLKRGQISILEAPNGWGKSSLLDSIVGLRNNNLEVSNGDIFFKERNITKLQTHQIARMGLAYLRANQQVFASLKIKEQMKLKHSSNHVFDGFLNGDSKGSSLSGGEKQKLLIDLLPEADLYLLDEPMIGLDEQAINAMKKNIIDMIKRQKTIIITIPYNI